LTAQPSYKKTGLCVHPFDIINAMSPKIYSTGEAAKAVGIARSTLHAWIANKKIVAPKAKKFGRVTVRLWKESDLARLRKTKEKIYWKGQGRPRKKK